MPDIVTITDVSPRDGLQNEPGIISTDDKVRLVEAVAASGVDAVEVSAFVSATWVPQLADAREVFARLFERQRTRPASGAPTLPRLIALVPNARGMEAVGELNSRWAPQRIDTVAVFTAASETFCRKNINCSLAESIERFRPVIRDAAAQGLRVRAYVSCVVACPFEGPTPPERVVDVISRLREAGARDEFDLGDTIGAGTPPTVARVQEEIVKRHVGSAGITPEQIVWHLHDTSGAAAACVRALLTLGVRSFDGSVAGLGGCPYASTPTRRAPGNISTETLVAAVHAGGFITRVDESRLRSAGTFARAIVAQPPPIDAQPPSIGVAPGPRAPEGST